MSKTPIRKKELARKMKAYCEGAYNIYEFEDFLDIFIQTVEDLVIQGEDVLLENFGTFTTRKNPARRVYSDMIGDYMDVSASLTFKFKVSENMQKRIREISRDAIKSIDKITGDDV